MASRQIQKFVNDIKKNDGGFMRKIKKLKNKPPPSVPNRDYVSDPPDKDHVHGDWSDDDFDSDYENPDEHSDSENYQVPGEDNYEPPPSAHKKMIAIPPAFHNSKEEYADKRPESRKHAPRVKQLPTIPYQPETAPRHLRINQKQKSSSDDEGDYVVPVQEDDENYVKPREESNRLPLKPPKVNRHAKPSNGIVSPSPVKLKPPPPDPCPEVYEVPDTEELSLSVTDRKKPLLPKPSPGKGSHTSVSHTPEKKRVIFPGSKTPIFPKPESKSYDEYEVCDHDDNISNTSSEDSKFSPPSAAPVPLPQARARKNMPPPKAPKPNVQPADSFSSSEDRRRGSNVGQEFQLPPVPPMAPKPPNLDTLPTKLSKPPEVRSRPSDTLPQRTSSSSAEQDSGVYNKVWYASTCARKTAEDALNKSNKDGSFLIRKSSGQDPKQPYTLVVFYKKRVYNIPVRYIDTTNQYALGREKSGEERFDSVADMVEHHQRNPLVLIDSQNNTKDSTKLKYPIQVS